MDKYEAMYSLIQEKVNNGDLSVEQAEVLNDAAYIKYVLNESACDDVMEESELEQAYADYNAYVESIQEMYNGGLITIEEANDLNDFAYDTLVEESFKIKSPISDKLKELNKIKNQKITKHDDDKVVKEFLNKNLDKIEECADLLEKEPKDVTKDAVIKQVVSMAGVIVGYVVFYTAAPTAGAIVVITSALLSCVSGLIDFIRVYKDEKGVNELKKIKKSLEKITSSKAVKDSQKARIEKIIMKIEDCEEESKDWKNLANTVSMMSIASSASRR